MIEIENSVAIDANSPPKPAIPILASLLLDLEERQRARFSGGNRDEKVKTESAEIDELLGGGLERGILVGISADGNMGRLISLHLLASILISHLPDAKHPSTTPKEISKAIVIDTTGSFPLSLFAKVLNARILNAQELSVRTANQTANYPPAHESTGKKAASSVESDVQRCLEMVALSRVFDVEGLWEVLGEVGRNADLDVGDAPPGDEVREELEKNYEIIDSQEVDTSIDEEVVTSPSTKILKESASRGTEIIVIDNMTHIINDLFSRKEKGEAHTLLSLLSQALHTLATTENILTILHNTTIPSKPSYSSFQTTNADTDTHNHDQRPNRQAHLPKTRHHPPPSLPNSIFPSNPQKPALGQIFAAFPSLHLFISPLPKSRIDANILYGRDDDTSQGLSEQREDVDFCTVLEVLKDETPVLGVDREEGCGNGRERKFGWREQRWTALDGGDGGIGVELKGAFLRKGDIRGLGIERERYGGLTDVGRMAKVHGFGGRRV